MAARSRLPARYQVQVITPRFTASAVVDRGFCISVDPELAPWLGCSAQWIYGRIRYEGWRGMIQALPDPEPAQGALL